MFITLHEIGTHFNYMEVITVTPYTMFPISLVEFRFQKIRPHDPHHATLT